MPTEKFSDNIFIVIVTYNGINWLPKCLSSCNGYKVIVVDNASTDNTVHYIAENFSEVVILNQAKNLGFGAANNIGISYALKQGADYVFLLNQDAYLIGDVLENLVSMHKQNTDFGILSPLHLDSSQNRLDRNFANYISFNNNPSLFSDVLLKKERDTLYEIPFVNAAAWLVSRDCLETVGGFDPLFFHYGEDDNYCQRVLFHGFKIGVSTTNFIIHDRPQINNKTTDLFSNAYYVSKLKSYKIRLANINDNDFEVHYKNCEKKLKRLILKSFLKLDYKGYKGFSKELSFLKSLKKEINVSRKKTSKKGLSYLDL